MMKGLIIDKVSKCQAQSHHFLLPCCHACAQEFCLGSPKLVLCYLQVRGNVLKVDRHNYVKLVRISQMHEIATCLLS